VDTRRTARPVVGVVSLSEDKGVSRLGMVDHVGGDLTQCVGEGLTQRYRDLIPDEVDHALDAHVALKEVEATELEQRTFTFSNTRRTIFQELDALPRQMVEEVHPGEVLDRILILPHDEMDWPTGVDAACVIVSSATIAYRSMNLSHNVRSITSAGEPSDRNSAASSKLVWLRLRPAER
jgi:hypothetical protein